jgi:leader peptidase (prepilin peptidase)/N-methyltransferase
MVPVLSWLLLRGRCRGCGERIPLIGFFLELGLGLFAGALVLAYHDPLRAGSAFLLIASALVLSLIDLRCRLVPVTTVRSVAALGLALQLAGGGVAALLDGLLGAAIGYALFACIHLLRPDGMGLGDAEVAGMHGAFLGGALSVIAILAGTIGGGLVGAVLLASGRAGRTTRLAFVPFLAGGAAFSLAFGNQIISLYFP